MEAVRNNPVAVGGTYALGIGGALGGGYLGARKAEQAFTASEDKVTAKLSQHLDPDPRKLAIGWLGFGDGGPGAVVAEPYVTNGFKNIPRLLGTTVGGILAGGLVGAGLGALIMAATRQPAGTQ